MVLHSRRVAVGNTDRAVSGGYRWRFLVVHFLRAPMSAAEKAAIAAHEGPEDGEPGEGYLYAWCPNGQGRSKLKLPRLGTARNWNAVTKLAAAARGE